MFIPFPLDSDSTMIDVQPGKPVTGDPLLWLFDALWNDDCDPATLKLCGLPVLMMSLNALFGATPHKIKGHPLR